MRALSIRQPWAWLVVNGYKDIENRTWVTRFRGRVYVHAGQLAMPPGSFPAQEEYIRQAGIGIPDDLPRGAIVGEVALVDCVSFAASPWFCGPYGWIVADPRRYEIPIPCRGRLGFFRVDETLISGYNGSPGLQTLKEAANGNCAGSAG